MNRRKKLTAVIASVCLVGVLGVGATLMFFTDTDTKQNVITLGKVDGTLTETGDGIEREDKTGFDYDNVVPGDKHAKKPVVTVAEDSQPAYLRMKLEITGELTTEQAAEIENGLDIKTDDWTKGTDGYYYYKEVLQPGEEAVYFENVTIPTTWNNELALKKFNIDVTAELIQSANFDANITTTDGKVTRWTVTE